MSLFRSISAAAFLAASILPVPAGAAVLLDFTQDNSAFDWYGTDRGCNSGCTLGYYFDVADSVTIDGLGVYDAGSDGLTHAHRVGLWDLSDDALLASVIVPRGASEAETSISGQGRFLFQTIADLILGTGRYVVGAQYRRGTQDIVAWDVDGIVSSAPGVSYGGMAWINSRQFARPTNTAPQDDRYFGPGLRLAEIAPVPLPAALPLMLAGLGALAFARSRRRAAASASQS